MLAVGDGDAGASFGGMLDVKSALDTVYSPFEVACLDVQGHLTGRPVSDLLGGAIRERVPFSGYLFYKWDAHPGLDPDAWGEALTAGALVAQAQRMIDGWGFSSLKLKGGVLPPDEECTAIEALREAFPDLPLRLDPNGAWNPETSIKVAQRLEGVIEYLEDPTLGIHGMAQVLAGTDVPLATNMCVIAFEHLPPAIAADAVQVVLSDHHLWGGLRRSTLLGGIAETFGLGLAMHSNSHLGISLAAMVHLAGGEPPPHLRMRHALSMENRGPDRARRAGVRRRIGGRPYDARPRGTLDRDRLGELHEQYLACGIRRREDTIYMQSIQPGFRANTSRW